MSYIVFSDADLRILGTFYSNKNKARGRSEILSFLRQLYAPEDYFVEKNIKIPRFKPLPGLIKIKRYSKSKL